MTEVADDLLGRVILQRYRVVRALAKGGMGVIYLARSEGAAGFIKPVVVKRILADLVAEDGMVRMFKREARIMSNLRHPGIVSVLDFGQEQSAYYMVLDYVHGFHLGRWYRFIRATRGQFPAELAIHIVINVLDALEYAHTLTDASGNPLRIVHRDVTPSNVLVDVQGHIKLADFGIARMKSDATEFKTSETTIKGKFPYIPPELFKGGEPGPSSDVYAAGVVLHELLMGKNEFRMQDVSSTIARVLQHKPSLVEPLREDAPKGLDEVLGRALAKSEAERYKTAQEFSEALRSIRQISPDKAASELSKTAMSDFNSTQMAEFFGVPPLPELDHAWRDAPMDSPGGRGRESDRATAHGGAGDLNAMKPTAPPTPKYRTPPPKKNYGPFMGIFGVIAMLGAGVVVLWPKIVGILQTNSAAPEITHIDAIGDVSEDQAAGNKGFEPPSLRVDASAPSEPTQQEKSADHGKRPRRSAIKTTSAMAELSHAFAKQGGALSECFRRFGTEIGGSPQIIVGFNINEQGQILSVELLPRELAQTPMGQCFIDVAKKTKFGPQKEPMSFKIPATVRRSGP